MRQRSYTTGCPSGLRLIAHLKGWDVILVRIVKAAFLKLRLLTIFIEVYAIWRMAEHLMNVMVNPPEDPGDVVEAIANLPDEDEIDTNVELCIKRSAISLSMETNTPSTIHFADAISYHLGREVHVILIQKTHTVRSQEYE